MTMLIDELLRQSQHSLQGNFVVQQNYPPKELYNQFMIHQVLSRIYPVNGVKFQLKIIDNCNRYNYHPNIVLIKFAKEDNDKSDYLIQFSSKKLFIDKKIYKSDDSWLEIASYTPACRNDNVTFIYIFDIRVDITAKPPDINNIFATLHEDTGFTDFELRVDDGSVPVHKAILAASSPVLRRMLEGKWSETREGFIEFGETSLETLQHLKYYFYTFNLPDTGLKQLLLLASCYMLTDLENKCIVKIMNGINAENALELVEFAVKHKMTKLLVAIMECFQKEYVKVEDVKKEMERKEKREAEETETEETEAKK